MRKLFLTVAVVIMLISALTACGKAPASPTSAPPTNTGAPTTTASPVPPTRTPPPPGLVLIAAAEARAGVKDAVRRWAEALAAEKGYAFTTQTPEKPVPSNAALVLAVGVAPPKAGKARLIVVNPPPKANLGDAQALYTASADILHRAFLAGYLAAVVTKDWRTGIVADASEEKAVEAYEDGVRYYCGLCRPLYPPFLTYPQFALVPAGAQQGEWMVAAHELVSAGKVQALVLSPLALKSPIPSANLNTNLIALPPTGEQAPQGNFAVSIEANIAAALDLLWKNPKVSSANAAMKIRVLKSGFVSKGRLRWVEETQKALEQGLIAP